jgi:aminopeptidase N
MLRGIVGEEAFRRGVRDFQARHRFAKAGSDDLREALEAASGRDLAPYFDAWVFGTALPTLRWGWRAEASGPGFRTTLEIRPRDLPGPVPLKVALVARSSREERTVELQPAGGRFTFETPVRPRRVELNPDRALLVHLERGERPQPGSFARPRELPSE